MAGTIEELLDVLQGNWHRDVELNIQCGPGWITLIEELHKELLAIDPNYRICNVKEKFGGLRYYAVPERLKPTVLKQFFKVVSDYERKSFTICEETGAPGFLMRRDGQFKTLSFDHTTDGWTLI